MANAHPNVCGDFSANIPSSEDTRRVENDFHSLPRRTLQALSKQIGIKANMSNADMADALQSLEIVFGIEMLSTKKTNIVSVERELSKRTTALGDGDMIEKAKNLIRKKNLVDSNHSTTTDIHDLGILLSFTSNSDHDISSKVVNLGISMGRNKSIIDSSITVIKNIEIDRLKVAAKEKLNKNKSISQNINLVEEDEDQLDALLDHACGNFQERMHEEGYDHICCELNAIPRKNKSNSIKKNKVGRPSKKPITPSKLSLE